MGCFSHVKDFVLHIICVIYSSTHIYVIYSVTCICDLYLRHLLYDLMNLHLFYKLLNWAWRLKYSRMLCRRWLWWFSCWLICACDICCGLHSPDLDLTYLCCKCVLIYKCPSRVWTMIFWMPYMVEDMVRVHTVRDLSSAAHADMLSWFSMLSSIYHGVLFHLQSELHIELMEWIHLLSCPNGQGSSQKRGLTF